MISLTFRLSFLQKSDEDEGDEEEDENEHDFVTHWPQPSYRLLLWDDLMLSNRPHTLIITSVSGIFWVS